LRARRAALFWASCSISRFFFPHLIIQLGNSQDATKPELAELVWLHVMLKKQIISITDRPLPIFTMESIFFDHVSLQSNSAERLTAMSVIFQFLKQLIDIGSIILIP
jgi:hypothetical protein